MKAEELRIGNWVNTVKGHRQCIDVLCGSINFQDIQNEIYDDIEPIPLTEEWLESFGFVKYDQMDLYSFWNYYSISNQKSWNIAIFHDGIYVSFGTLNWDNCPIIQYVHQLQNLYFALTGEELTIK